MKKIILSVAVATMALSTTAAALSDIKVSGQAKLWYETKSAGETAELFTKGSGGQVAQLAYALKITGKQGNIGFGAKIIDASSVSVLGAARDNSADDGLTVSEMYVTAPMGSKTSLKIGKQQIQTPFAFSENWQSVPNTFNAALIVNKSIKNVTLVGAYVGQGNTGANGGAARKATDGSFKVTYDARFSEYWGTDVYAAIAHYKGNGIAANAYAYEVSSVANLYWTDASVKMGPVSVKAILAKAAPKKGDDTDAYALSVGMKAGFVSLSAAYSVVSDEGTIAIANTATNFKKTKLPTAGVYTDGVYVAQMGSTAMKIKAVSKIAGAKVILQAIQNSNDITASKETTELDLIVIKKIGDFKFKGIVLNRSFDLATEDTAKGGLHFRLITSLSF